MSVKLYGGLRLIDPKTDIFELTPKIAAAVRPVFEEASRRLVADELFRFVDGHDAPDSATPRRSILSDLEADWKKRQRDYGSHHTLNDPLRFSMVFGRSSEGNLLAYPYYREPSYDEAIRELGLFEDYHYQDQTEEPAEFTRKQWKARGKEWESLENFQGTFGDLPSWELGRTDEPFEVVYWSHGKEDFDPNLYTTADERLREILVQRLFRHASEELNFSQDQVIPLYGHARRVVGLYLNSKDRSSGLLSPEPLPVGAYITYQDLPAPYTIDVTVFIELFRRLKADIHSE